MQQHISATPWPGDPAAVWTTTASSPLPHLDRPRNVPRPESVAEVARWEDPDRTGRVETYHAPAFWVFLPLVALGYLTWGAVTDPGGPRWVGAVFDETVEGEPWDFWPVWAGVGIWLLVAIGALIHRAGFASAVRADNQRIFEHGVAQTLHRTPFDTDDGEGGSRPTFIALGHRIADDRAERHHAALHAWLSRDDVQATLASAPGPGVISSGELFGQDAVGGDVLHSNSDLGGADDFAAHRWGLFTQPRDEENTLNVTSVPLEPKLRKIRAKAARRDAR